MYDATQLETAENAALFEALHRLLNEPNGAHDGNRRRSDRRSFDCVQLLAFCDGRSPPAQRDFRLARFHDLSPGGFSFFTSEAPQLQFVVVALGSVPFSFFLAQILHVHAVRANVRGPYLLGCRFAKRILSPSDWT